MKQREGQSFVEVVIIVAIVALVVTGLVIGTVASLKSTNFANSKSQATKYAQEGIELARQERDTSWYAFFSKGSAGGTSWCVNKSGTWTAGANCGVNIDNAFTRSIIYTWNAAAQRMEVVVRVVWQDAGGSHQSEIQTYFTKWR